MNESIIIEPLGNIFKTTSGGTPSRKRFEFYQGDIPWVKSGELENNIIFDTEEKITEDAIENSSAKIFPAGTILIALYGVTIGKLAFLGIKAATNQAICGIFDNGVILSKYTYYFLFYSRPKLVQSGIGGAQPNISQNIVRKQPFPIIPLPEQRAIVSKIEQLFSDLDNGIDNFKKAQEQLKRYRQSVLKAACEGRLVPTEAELACAEGRDYEPADVLLARILKERREKWNGKGKYKEPVAPDTNGLPELPEGWCYTHIEALLSTNRTGIKTGPFGSLLKKHEHRIEGIPVLGIENIKAMKFIAGSKIRITKEKSTQLCGYDALPDDVLISRSGTVGEVCVVPEGLGEARISTNLIRVTLAPIGMLPIFFTFLFNGSPDVLDQVTDLCKGSTRNFLNRSILFSLIFIADSTLIGNETSFFSILKSV